MDNIPDVFIKEIYMRNLNGWWSFPRSMLNHEVWKGNIWASRTLIFLISAARWSDEEGESPFGLKIKPGEVITSTQEIIEAVQFRMGKGGELKSPGRETIRWALKTLEEHGMITINPPPKTTPHGYHISICNWELYQPKSKKQHEEHQENPRKTPEEPPPKKKKVGNKERKQSSGPKGRAAKAAQADGPTPNSLSESPSKTKGVSILAEESSKSTRKKRKFSPEAKQVTNYLRDKLIDAGCSVEKDWNPSYSVTQSMLDDGIPPEKIQKTIDLALEDEFWSSTTANMKHVRTFYNQRVRGGGASTNKKDNLFTRDHQEEWSEDKPTMKRMRRKD